MLFRSAYHIPFDNLRAYPVIIDYLKEKYNLREGKNIDNHLIKLRADGLIVKREMGKGHPVFFKLNDDYICFLLMKSGLEKKFSFTVKGHSMEPTLYPGDEINIEITKNLRVGDIVVFMKRKNLQLRYILVAILIIVDYNIRTIRTPIKNL